MRGLGQVVVSARRRGACLLCLWGLRGLVAVNTGVSEVSDGSRDEK
jgi:hypothetical protein